MSDLKTRVELSRKANAERREELRRETEELHQNYSRWGTWEEHLEMVGDIAIVLAMVAVWVMGVAATMWALGLQ